VIVRVYGKRLFLFRSEIQKVIVSSTSAAARQVKFVTIETPIFYTSMSQPAQGGPAGGAGDGQARPQSKRLQQTQAQVDEVVGIMKVNVEKVLERDAKLSQLDDRADALQEGASQFEKSAATLKRKYWWKNCKMIIILCAIVCIIIIIIVVWAVTSNQ